MGNFGPGLPPTEKYPHMPPRPIDVPSGQVAKTAGSLDPIETADARRRAMGRASEDVGTVIGTTQRLTQLAIHGALEHITTEAEKFDRAVGGTEQ